MNSIPASTFQFLSELTSNNSCEWFKANNKIYEREHQHIIAFAEAMLDRMKTLDKITTVSGKKSLMRIYRDVRFSNDKTPHDPRFAGNFS